jgi:hypothetical protein
MSAVIDRVLVGDCFIKEEHFFLQREDDVLHVFPMARIINSIKIPAISDDLPKFNKIDRSEFDLAVKKTIYEMELYSFWGKN